MNQTLPDTNRPAKIAAIHDLAHWLAANPSVPVPVLDLYRHLNSSDGTEIENLATVRKLAADLGVETDERLDDRTVLHYKVGGFITYELCAWHKAGRPGQPDPRDAELERLRAEVAELKQARKPFHQVEPDPMAAPVVEWMTRQLANPTGLTYQREDDDPRVVRPHSPRVPLHIGVVEQGGELVDETPEEPLVTGDELVWDRSEVGETDEPVTVYFTFGHGHTDPDTGKDLLNHYVTIVGPSYEACREAMFASKYGNRWSFDYLHGTPTTDIWIPRWTEHERIVLPEVEPVSESR